MRSYRLGSHIDLPDEAPGFSPHIDPFGFSPYIDPLGVGPQIDPWTVGPYVDPWG